MMYDDPFLSIVVATTRGGSGSPPPTSDIPQRLLSTLWLALWRRYSLAIDLAQYAVAQYAVALSAAANVFHASLNLARRSVLSWKCEFSYFPFVWAVVPVAAHALGMLALRIVAGASRAVAMPGEERVGDGGDGLLPRSPLHRPTLVNELEACIAQVPMMVWPARPGVERPFALHRAGIGGGACNVWDDLFSSLLPLRFVDAVPLIFRYALSVLVCRLISAYELAGMSETLKVRYAEEREEGNKEEGRQIGRPYKSATRTTL